MIVSRGESLANRIIFEIYALLRIHFREELTFAYNLTRKNVIVHQAFAIQVTLKMFETVHK